MIIWTYRVRIGKRVRIRILGFRVGHRYTSEIPEPALSSAYVTYMYWGLKKKANMPKTEPKVQRSWMHLFEFVFACVVCKKPKDPKSSPMAHDGLRCHYTGWYRRSRIYGVYLHSWQANDRIIRKSPWKYTEQLLCEVFTLELLSRDKPKPDWKQ